MKYLVFSDSHRRTDLMESVIRSHSEYNIIHLGDVYEDVETIRREFPYRACCSVIGNNDFFRRNEIKELVIEDNGHKIFLCHGHTRGVKSGIDGVLCAALSKGCDIALFGHTHIKFYNEINGVKLLNPGSIGYSGTYATLDVNERGVDIKLCDALVE